jgi:type IV secretion system protein VirB4
MLRDQVGDAPQRWYPLLTGHPWPGEGGDDLPWLEAAE